MFNFKQWLEMSDVVNQSVDDIALEPNYKGWSYRFKVGNNNYAINFLRKNVLLGSFYGMNLQLRGINISFIGPQGDQLTGLGQGPTIYRHVIKAVMKLIQQEQPQCLQFEGAVASQQVMYDNLYKRFLSKQYTRINQNQYVSNILIQQWKDSNSPEYQKFITLTQGFDPNKAAEDAFNIKRGKMKKPDKSIFGKKMH